ncbi:carbohydrate ABC transporter permease [Paenibacillus sp. 1P07SE]|uniref:carbohydrate ABC transporter permease n=1 Tax=Paenibacillus sp. 1P07SE TaxID=3132209 RepID=UPI0039A51543
MKRQRIHGSRGDFIFTIVNYFLMGLLLLVVLYPLVFILSASFSSTEAVIAGKVWLWPVEPNLEGYKAAFKSNQIATGFLNSLIYTVAGTFVNVIITLLAAYPMSRRDLYGKNLLMFVFVFTMMFNGGLIPNYLLVKDLGMLDTRWALILPGALSIWNMIIARTYFQQTIPKELLEAAQMDGCNDFKFLGKVVLPLSGPIIAVIALFYAVGHWNQFFLALIYLRDQALLPLQIILRNILIQNSIQDAMLADAESAAHLAGLRELLKYSTIVIATAPILIVYPFVQRFFVKGMMIGSLKG